jgi:two-component sensor histidine kinase
MAPGRRPLLLTLALAIAWLLLGSIEAASGALMGRQSLRDIVKNVAGWTVAGFLICLLLFWLFGILERRYRGWRLVGAATLAGLAMVVLRILLGAFLRYLGVQGFLDGAAPKWQNILASALWNLVWLALFSFLYFTISYWLELQEQRKKMLQATALAHQAQLQMLRYQLNPHFLFNALNSIRAMILEDAAKSRQMITRLSELLRYSLDGDTKEATIGGEIAAIQNYLALQHIRYERKLEVTTRIDPEAESAVIPCFLIHPLVENAIKYGIDTSPMPLKVAIEVSRRDDQLQIRVRNTGRLASGASAEGTGTGLRNITQRLDLVFPGRHAFRIHEDDGWVHAEIDLALDATV